MKIPEVGLIAMLALTNTSGAAPPVVEPPNLLLISIDTLRADHLPTYGYSRNTAPRIEALANRAFVCTQAHSAGTWTPPSIASIMTGLLPIHHGMIGGPRRLAAEFTTLAERLRAVGYTTRAVVQNTWLNPAFGMSQGFDEYRQFDFLGNPLCAPEIEGEIEQWLGAHSKDPFFLWLHYLAPHCPYEGHEPYATEFSPREFDPDLEQIEFGKMQDLRDADLSEQDLARVIALYDSEICYVDMHIGRILESLGRTGGSDRTIVVLLGDHGEEFKDRGGFGHFLQAHQEITRVPFLLSLPGQSRRVEIAHPVGTVDLVPTIARLLGIEVAHECDGKALLDVAELSDREAVASSLGSYRPSAASSFVFTFKYDAPYAAQPCLVSLLDPGRQVDAASPTSVLGFPNVFAARDARFTLICDTDQPDLERCVALKRAPRDPGAGAFLAAGRHYFFRLYDRAADSSEKNDVIDDHPEDARRLALALRDEFRRQPNLAAATAAEIDGALPTDVQEQLRQMGYTAPPKRAKSDDGH